MTIMGKGLNKPIKIEEWKPEDILADESAVKEIIVPYGNSQDKLVPGLHYPIPVVGGQFFSGNVSYSSTGVKTISGVGFKPKMIKISAGVNGGNSGYSDGYYYNGSIYCRYIYFNAGVGTVGHFGYSGYIQIGGNSSITTTISPTTDGFTINVADVSAGTLQIIYECYG